MSWGHRAAAALLGACCKSCRRGAWEGSTRTLLLTATSRCYPVPTGHVSTPCRALHRDVREDSTTAFSKPIQKRAQLCCLRRNLIASTSKPRLSTLQVTHYQDDEVVIVCSGKSKLAGRAMLHKDELMSLQWVSLFKSSTVQAIKTTLEREGINWKAMQVVLVSAHKVAVWHAAAAWLSSSHNAHTVRLREHHFVLLHIAAP